MKPVIFHIAKWYPNKHDSLLGIFVKRHILSTLPYTNPVALYVMASDQTKGWFDIQEGMEDGIYTYRSYYRKRITGIDPLDRLIKLLLYFIGTWTLYRRAKKVHGKPDLINTHVLLRTAVLANSIQIFDRVPYVMLEHSTSFIRPEINATKNILTHWIMRYVVKNAKAVITVSCDLANGMKRYNLANNNYKVVYNSVNTELFSEGDKSVSHPIKELLYVVEFNEFHKNTKGLLEVIAKLSQKRNDFILRIIGYGKDELFLHGVAESLNIKDKIVFFEGKKTGQELADRIKQADALLLFSNFENLSCIITESLCCGTPVVSTAVGGTAEIVNEENGLLVPKADQKAMMEAIEKILDNRIAFDHHKISVQAKSLFSNQAVGEKLVAIYKESIAC